LLGSLQDSEARIRLLRERFGSSKSRRKEEEERERELLEQAASGSGSSTAHGHINLFEDLEQVSFSGTYKYCAHTLKIIFSAC
jgi:hypothetical protein